MTDHESDHLEHSALRADLDLSEIVLRFWDEVRPLAPKSELHVVDPYVLSSGNRPPQVHADNLVSLLKPLVRDLTVLTFVYRNELPGVRAALQKSLGLLLRADTNVRFVRPAKFHHRWVVADRSRLARMDMSFNQIGQALGGIDMVTDHRDRAEYCAVLAEQDPLLTL